MESLVTGTLLSNEVKEYGPFKLSSHQGIQQVPSTGRLLSPNQSPFPSRANRGGSKARKTKTREEADNKKTCNNLRPTDIQLECPFINVTDET